MVRFLFLVLFVELTPIKLVLCPDELFDSEQESVDNLPPPGLAVDSVPADKRSPLSPELLEQLRLSDTVPAEVRDKRSRVDDGVSE